VRPKRARERPQVRAFIDWLKQEFAALDWTIFDPTVPAPDRNEDR
jgi:hypothetical protein